MVVGVPGQIVTRSKPHRATDAPDLNHTALPDTIGVSLALLIKRLEAMELRLDGQGTSVPHSYVDEKGAWRGEDFSI